MAGDEHFIDGGKCGDVGGHDPRGAGLDELGGSALERAPGRHRGHMPRGFWPRTLVALAGVAVVAVSSVVATGGRGPTPLAHSRPTAASSPLGLDNEDQYPLVNSVPDPIPPGGVSVNHADVILTPPPADPAITAAQAIADAEKNATVSVVPKAVLANLTIPGTQDDPPVAYIDGIRTYPRVQDLTVWLVIFPAKKPFWPYIGWESPDAAANIPVSKYLPPMTATVVAIDASNGNFVTQMYY